MVSQTFSNDPSFFVGNVATGFAKTETTKDFGAAQLSPFSDYSSRWTTLVVLEGVQSAPVRISVACKICSSFDSKSGCLVLFPRGFSY